MTPLENTLMNILVEARALEMAPDLKPETKKSVGNIVRLATETLNGSVRKARTPKAKKEGDTAPK